MMGSRPPRGGRGLKFIEILTYIKQTGGRPPRGGRGLKLTGRNNSDLVQCSRPPRGGRGLKCQVPFGIRLLHKVAPLAGGVD